MADIRKLKMKLLYKLYKKITDPSFFHSENDNVVLIDEKSINKKKLIDIILHLLVYPIYVQEEFIDSLRGYRFTIKPDIKINKQIEISNWQIVNGLYLHKVCTEKETRNLIKLIREYVINKFGNNWLKKDKQIISPYVNKDKNTCGKGLNEFMKLLDDTVAYQLNIIIKRLYYSLYSQYEKQFIDEEIIEKSNFGLLYYSTNIGLRHHTDSILTQTGCISVISFEDSILDFIPFFELKNDYNSFRTILPRSYAITFDGNLRYYWTHGIPSGIKINNGYRFAINIRHPNIPSNLHINKNNCDETKYFYEIINEGKSFRRDGFICKSNILKPSLKFNLSQNSSEVDSISNLEGGLERKMIYKGKIKNIDFEEVLPTYDTIKPIQYDKTIPNIRPLHWGQRKLFMAELDFFTRYAKKNDTVLLIAPSYGIIYINELFKDLNLKFIIWDIIEYNIKLPENIEYNRGELTEKIAQKYVGKIDLFMSDIRKKYDPEIPNDRFHKFMDAQKLLVEIIKPKISSLKFKLLYTGSNYNYFDGDVNFHLWSNGSTESRLVFKLNRKRKYDYKDYDINEYNEKFMAFVIARCKKYHNPMVNKVKYYDYCYDCSYEYILWKNYCKKYECTNIKNYIELATKYLNDFHNTHITLKHKYN